MYGSHWAKCFMWIISFNLHKDFDMGNIIFRGM